MSKDRVHLTVQLLDSESKKTLYLVDMFMSVPESGQKSYWWSEVYRNVDEIIMECVSSKISIVSDGHEWLKVSE